MMTQREFQDLASEYQLETTAIRCGYELIRVKLINEEQGSIRVITRPDGSNKFALELVEPLDFGESWKAQTTSYGSLPEDECKQFVKACDNALTMVQLLNDFYFIASLLIKAESPEEVDQAEVESYYK